MALRSKQRTVHVKSEGSNYGVYAAPAATDALLINDDLELTPIGGESVSLNVIRPWRGAQVSLRANTQVGITFSVDWAASGTAGTAPRYADLLRSCSEAQTITASPLTGSAQAGAAGTITLAASGTSAVDGFYNGQIISIVSGTGDGHVGLIVGYDGTSKVALVNPISETFVPGASSGYSIATNVAFKPLSKVRGVADTSVTIVYNVDGVEHRLRGCRGTWSVAPSLGQVVKLVFTMTGIYTEPTDAAQIAATYGQPVPLVFRRGNVQGFRFFGVPFCLSSLSLDYGNEVNYRELINCTEQVDIADGMSSGTVMVESTLMATYNPFAAAFNDGVTGSLGFVLGTTAGQRAALVCPRCDLGDPSYSRENGFEMTNLPFMALPGPNGNDDVYMVFS